VIDVLGEDGLQVASAKDHEVVEALSNSPWLPSRPRTVESFLAGGVVLCSVGPLELVGSGLRESPVSGFLHHVNDDMVTASR